MLGRFIVWMIEGEKESNEFKDGVWRLACSSRLKSRVDILRQLISSGL